LENANKITDFIVYYIKSIFSPFVFSGLVCYAFSMIAWLWVLSRYELSYARPFVALGYIIVTLYSFFFLGENVSWERWLGIGLIIVGVILVAKS
jgi:drug/metabolite transporter (DMT)-like permease